MKLKDKVAVITGASRGIGYSVADAFLREGARIVLCGSRPESAQKAAAKLKEKYPHSEIMPAGVDVTDTAAIDALIADTVSRFGRIDILVNNAGVTDTKSILEMEDADFERVLNINLCGPFKFTRAVARVMKETGGSIINTSSMVGTYGGKMQTAYSSSKFGINGLTKSCAKELGRYNIRVNAVAPGVTATDMVAAAVSEQMKAAMSAMTPLGRMGNPDELAGAYVYLASDEASFTTGTIIHVDGGIVM
jgi:NAD(P)-dependent dehydrogenase (short-subunit alcohol dehydrogenase family)